MRSMQSSIARGVAVILVIHLGFAIQNLAYQVTPVVAHPNLSYDDKLLNQLGTSYEIVRFLQKETPQDAALLLPPGSNSSIDRYFLFPRKLYYGDITVLQEHPEIEYVVISDRSVDLEVVGDRKMLDAKRGVIRIRK
jgi:hypothetical protein